MKLETDLGAIEWEHEAWYRVLSYYFGLRIASTDLADSPRYLLGPFRVPRDPTEERVPPLPAIPPVYSLLDAGDGQEVRYRLFYGDLLLAAADTPGYVVDQLLWHVNGEAVRRTGDLVLIHAGAVATGDGRAVVLPGASGAGKSTLVAGLVRAGFGYLSDEAAAIDPIDRKVHPYPKALAVGQEVLSGRFPHVQAARGTAAKRHVLAEDLRPGSPAGPAPLRFVVVAQYHEGAALELTPMSRGEAAFRLGENTMNRSRYGRRLLPLLAELVAGSECFRLVSGDLSASVESIRELTS